MKKKFRLMIFVNDPGFFLSHRLPIALAAREAGYEVHVVTGEGEGDIVQHGMIHHVISLSRSKKNIFSEIFSLLNFVRVLNSVRPHLLHLVTIKPVIYGGIAARLLKVPAVLFAISGLGFISTDDSPKSKVLRLLISPFYRFALGHPNSKIVFQNEDDQRFLQALTNQSHFDCVTLKGSGVDLDSYIYRPETLLESKVVFAARLLIDKGVLIFVDAARILKARGVKAEFLLAGSPDFGNPNSISSEQVENFKAEGLVEVLGFVSDIDGLFSKANIVTLPSFYGEGFPKVLIEAAACGRAIVTTNHTGCRDAVLPGVTGILVPPRDAEALADALELLISDEDLRQSMGAAGRRLAEDEYSILSIVNAHIGLYESLLRTDSSKYRTDEL